MAVNLGPESHRFDYLLCLYVVVSLNKTPTPCMVLGGFESCPLLHLGVPHM